MPETLAELVPRIQNIFEFLSVHKEMIYDEVRTSAYSRAIGEAVKPGDGVMAVEKTNIIEVAKANARKMGIADRIEFIMADSRVVDISEKVDVIVSEVIGHLVVEENMLDSIIDARDRFLKPGGKLIPSSASMFFVPVEARDMHDQEIGIWSNYVEGVDLSGSQEFAVNNIYLGEFTESNYLGTPTMLFHLDLRNADSTDMSLVASYDVSRDGVLHGLAGWFVAQLLGSTEISTSPVSKRTHWKQCFVPVKCPVPVKTGNCVSFKFSSRTIGDDVVIEWQVVAPSFESGEENFGRSRSTMHNERSVSLKKLWLNNGTDSAAEFVSKRLLSVEF